LGTPCRSLRRVPGVQRQEGLGDRFPVVCYNLCNTLQVFALHTHGHSGTPSQVPPPRSMASADDGDRVAVTNVVHRRGVEPSGLSSADSDQRDAVAHKAVQRRTEQDPCGPVGERGCYVDYLHRGLPPSVHALSGDHAAPCRGAHAAPNTPRTGEFSTSLGVTSTHLTKPRHSARTHLPTAVLPRKLGGTAAVWRAADSEGLAIGRKRCRICGP